MRKITLAGLVLLGAGAAFAEPAFTLSVDKDDISTFRARLAWTVDGAAGAYVAVERAPSADGPWTEMAAGLALDASWTDEDASIGYGVPTWYRLVCLGSASDPVQFRRLRKLTISPGAAFGPAQSDCNWYGIGYIAAFDGDTGTRPDFGCSHYRMGVDFGSPFNYLALVRVFPRNDYAQRSDQLAFSGIDKSGAYVVSDKFSAARGVKMTGNLQYDGTVRWYELPVAEPACYRTYYISEWRSENNGNGINTFYGNVAEIEFYGWTKADVNEMSPSADYTVSLDYAYEGSANPPELRPQIGWGADAANAGETATLQRAPSLAGPWEDIYVVTAAGSYTDGGGDLGHVYYYRVKVGENISNVVSGRRMRKLSTEGYATFWNGTPWNGNAAHDGGIAFNGAFGGGDYTDLNDYGKIGVDFGAATNVVAAGRVYPRADQVSRATVAIYGTDEDEATVMAGDRGTRPGAKLSGNLGPIPGWNLLLATADPRAYRTYYYADFKDHGDISELEFYGWSLEDYTFPDLAVTGVRADDSLVLNATVDASFNGEELSFYCCWTPPGATPDLANAVKLGDATVADGAASITGAVMKGAKAVFFVCTEAGDSASGELVVEDDAGYAWKGEATGARLWEDAANWTCTAASAEGRLGYPGYCTGSVRLDAADGAEISVNAMYRLHDVHFAGDGGSVTLKGVNAAESGLECDDSIDIGVNKTLAFDDLYVRGQNARLDAGDEMSLLNGAKFDVSWWFYVTGENAHLYVDPYSILDTSVSEGRAWWGLVLNGKDAWVEIAGTVLAPRVRIGRNGDGDWPGTPQPYAPRGITFKGAAPVLAVAYEFVSMNEFQDGKTPVIEYLVPAGGYAQAPLRAGAVESDIAYPFMGDWYQDYGAHTPIADAAHVAFVISPESPVYSGDPVQAFTTPLARWPAYSKNADIGGGIDTDRVDLTNRSGVMRAELSYTYRDETPEGVDAEISYTEKGLKIFLR